MTLQFNMVALLLVFLIVLGLISQNSAITISAAVLLIMQQTLLSKYIPILEQYGVKIGIIILTIGVLAPLVSGEIQLPDLSSFLNWKMGVSIATGIFVAWLAGKGVPLMSEQPVLGDRIINWYDYWCVFLRRYSGGTSHRCRDFSGINRKIFK